MPTSVFPSVFPRSRCRNAARRSALNDRRTNRRRRRRRRRRRLYSLPCSRCRNDARTSAQISNNQKTKKPGGCVYLRKTPERIAAVATSATSKEKPPALSRGGGMFTGDKSDGSNQTRPRIASGEFWRLIFDAASSHSAFKTDSTYGRTVSNSPTISR